MFCPKCGTENTDNAQACHSCGHSLKNGCSSPQEKTAKTSAIAIWSFILALLSIAFIGSLPLVPESKIFLILWAILLTAILSMILGITALVKIPNSKGRLKGSPYAVIGILVPLFIFFIGLILPSLNVSPRPAREVRQKCQLHSIDAALELFASEVNGYPPSDAMDKDKKPYCGAMKLCEAMMGQDLLGFHPDSHFRRDGTNDYNNPIYGPATLQARKGPFLQIEMSNAYQLKDIYKNFGPFDRNSYVICDTYTKQRYSGKRIGMPVLYYKANNQKTAHNLDNPDDPNNIYNYKDNYALLSLGIPEDPNKKHPLFSNPKIFYEMTKNYMITIQNRPCRADSYILISAGPDGLYGTKDDIGNFEMGWRPK
jgi:hypothetical protein